MGFNSGFKGLKYWLCYICYSNPREEVTDDRTNLDNKDLHNLYSLSNIYPIKANMKIILYIKRLPVPVAARSKAYVCGRSPAEIVGSNPTGGMDVCLL